MADQNRDFSSPDPGALLQDPGIAALFAKLQQLDPAILQQAAAMASAGDAAGARALIGSLAETEEPHDRF